MSLDKVLQVAAVYSTAYFAVLWWMNPDVNLSHWQLLSSSLGHTQAGYANVPSMCTTCLAVCRDLPDRGGNWREPFVGSRQQSHATPTLGVAA